MSLLRPIRSSSRSERARRARLAVLVLGLAAACFVAGAVTTLGLVAAGRGGRIVARLRHGLFETARADTSRWQRLPTALHTLEWRSLPVVPVPERAGAFTWLPDGSLLVATAHGDFYRVDSSDAVSRIPIAPPLNIEEFLASPFARRDDLDPRLFRINDILAVARPGAPELLDLYAHHHVFHADATCVELRLSHTTLRLEDGGVAPDAGSWRTLTSIDPCVPIETSRNPRYDAFNGDVSGGRLLLRDDATLMMTVGDGQLYEKSGLEVAQDPATLLGKIALVDRETGAATLFASGFRNPQGLWRDREGRIWAAEHGPRGGDELNRIEQGANYGWPQATYGVHYDLRPWLPGRPEGGHEFGTRPVFAFVPSIGASPLIQTDVRQFPNWRGDLLLGTLATHELVRIRIEGEDAVYAEVIPVPVSGFRDLDVAADGSIVALSNEMEILWFRNANGPGSLAVAPLVTPQEDLARSLASLPPERAEQIRTGAELFAERCAECHSLGGGVGSAPPLLGIVGRGVAEIDGYAYSPALAERGGEWTEEQLTAFLVDPDGFAPGQLMPAPRLDEAQAQAVVAYVAHVTALAERE